MPTEIKALLRDDDGSGGVGGLTGEHELCALSYNPSDEPTEVIVLIKNEGGNEMSSDPPLSDNSLPLDVPNGSSRPMVDKSSSPSKKMPENEKALALGLKFNLLSGNNSKGAAKENATPQKGTNDDGSFATLGCTKAALFVSGGGSEDGQFGTNSVSTTASVINDVPHATTKRIRSDIENENGPVEKCSEKKYCSWEGCTNGAIKGGVCWRHGAKSTTNKKKCSSEGCTKYAQKGGLCRSHGTKVESALSKHINALLALLRQTAAKGEKRVPESLLNPVREETMAALRGAGFLLPVFRALQEAENNAILLYTREIEQQQRRLLEAMHGGAENEGQCETKAMLVACANGNNATLPTAAAATSKRPRCDNENEKRPPAKKQYRYECTADGCTNWAILGGVCWRHGAKNKKKCSSEGCGNYAVNGGVCVRHGAKVKRCSSEGCKSQAQTGGVCMKHGAHRKRCSSEGCTNQIQKGGVCWRHGAKDLMKKA